MRPLVFKKEGHAVVYFYLPTGAILVGESLESARPSTFKEVRLTYFKEVMAWNDFLLVEDKPKIVRNKE